MERCATTALVVISFSSSKLCHYSKKIKHVRSCGWFVVINILWRSDNSASWQCLRVTTWQNFVHIRPFDPRQRNAAREFTYIRISRCSSVRSALYFLAPYRIQICRTWKEFLSLKRHFANTSHTFFQNNRPSMLTTSRKNINLQQLV